MAFPCNSQILILYFGDLRHHIASFPTGLKVILNFSLSPAFTPPQHFVNSTFDILNNAFSFSVIPAFTLC